MSRTETGTRLGAQFILCFVSLLAEAQYADDPAFVSPEPQGVGDPAYVWREATIYRDAWGTPHVYADNFRALAFAFGYAQADDHLEAMLSAYWIATGRAAAVFGETYADSDAFSLMMGHGELAAEALANADLLTRDLCEGFAEGVNSWLVRHPKRVPEWADGVHPADVLALWHCYLTSLAPFDLPGAYRRHPLTPSANAWAIGPPRSQTGEAILVINPHQAHDGPFRWYEAHLVTADMNVAGATLFGLPVILQGHNDALGWALAPNKPDFADMYLEPQIQLPDPRRLGDLSRQEMSELAWFTEAMTETRTYFVKTPSGFDEREVRYCQTPRGPVIGQQGGRFCSYLIGGYRDFGGLSQLVEMAGAQDLDQFIEALERHQLPCFHIVYADRDGNILYRYNAKLGAKRMVPLPGATVRGEADPEPISYYDWTQPLPGEDLRLTWGDPIPASALPTILNPPAGYVQACETLPWNVSDDLECRPEDWPEWIFQDRDSLRAQRVRSLLRTGARSSHEMQSMLYDVVVPAAVDAVPRLLETADAYPELVLDSHPDVPEALDLLDQWNYVADTDSVGMTLFHLWWNAFRSLAAPTFDKEPNDAALVAQLSEAAPGIQELALEAVADVARAMRNEFPSLIVPWGDVHTLRRGERDAPVAGASSGEPIFLTSDWDYVDGKWPATHGYGFAMVVAFGETPEAVTMVPFGASENPRSPHYADQLDLMLERRFKFTRFRREEVQRHAASAYGQVLHLRTKGADALFVLHTPEPVSARMTSSAEAPQPLPPGAATFTVYMKPEYEPQVAFLDLEIEIFVPEVVCAPEDLSLLAVHAWEQTGGWAPLPLQETHLDEGILRAYDDATRTYAVLGPATVRKSTVAPETFLTGIAERPTDLEPPTDPSSPPSAPEPLLGVVAGRETAPTPQPEPLEFEADAVAPDIETIAEKPDVSEPEAEQVEAAVFSSEKLRTWKETGQAELQERIASPEERPSPEILEEPDLPELRTLTWGNSFALRSPDIDGTLRITSKKAVGLRLVALAEAPAPLPNGLAAFTTFVVIRCSSLKALLHTQIDLAVPPGVCAEEHLSKLALYTYSVRRGWHPIEGQTTVENGQRFQALALDENPPRPRSRSPVKQIQEQIALLPPDGRRHIFVVLGPKECLHQSR
ncbi:MAG TPA: penicillin acylase family protein [Candidatus Hydrogenedentes bacterium]|nr:penicillin acylase family protein [Candidatus Hydrogenedentota bacterium]